LEIDLEHLLIYVPVPPPLPPLTSLDVESGKLFSIRYQFDLWKLFLGHEEDLETFFPHITIPSSSSLSPSSDYICVNGLTVCKAIINLSNQPISYFFLFTITLALIFASIPLLFIFLFPSLYSLQSLSPSTSLTISFVLYWVSSFTINLIQYNALVMMLLVCTMDAYRKYKIFVLISSLIRANDVDMDTMHISSATPSSTQTPVGQAHQTRSGKIAPNPTGSMSGIAESELKTDSVGNPLPPTPSSKERRGKRKSSILLPNQANSLLPHSHTPVSPVVEISQILPIEEEEMTASIEPSNRSQETQEPEAQLLITKQGLPIQPQYAFKAYVGDDSESIVPRLDFDIRNNIFSWSSVRLVFHNFGERMKVRIDIYLGKGNRSLGISPSLISPSLITHSQR
jgi:hypothetical protein